MTINQLMINHLTSQAAPKPKGDQVVISLVVADLFEIIMPFVQIKNIINKIKIR